MSFGWHLPRGGRVLVVGAGKAAASLARGMERILGNRIDDGLIIVKYGHSEPLQRIGILEAGHPVPDEAGEAATGQLLELVSGLRPQDRVFVLVTGGASSLLVAPREGVTLADKCAVTEAMLRCGMSIDEMNVVRIALSRVKGGKLLDALAPAQATTLLISDIPSGDPGLIGSGPTVPRRAAASGVRAIVDRYGLAQAMRAPVRAVLAREESLVAIEPEGRLAIVADSKRALAAARNRAVAVGCRVCVINDDMRGGTHVAAALFAARLRAEALALTAGEPPVVLLAAGETTLTVRGTGMGGRNQEFALVAARELAGLPRAVLLSAGTDGTDGPTEAAGAFADGTTVERSAAMGWDAKVSLDDNDSYRFFKRLGDTFVTGPTGTNVMDLVVGVAYAAPA